MKITSGGDTGRNCGEWRANWRESTSDGSPVSEKWSKLPRESVSRQSGQRKVEQTAEREHMTAVRSLESGANWRERACHGSPVSEKAFKLPRESVSRQSCQQKDVQTAERAPVTEVRSPEWRASFQERSTSLGVTDSLQAITDRLTSKQNLIKIQKDRLSSFNKSLNNQLPPNAAKIENAVMGMK